MRLYPRQVRHHSELWKIKMFEGKKSTAREVGPCIEPFILFPGLCC